MNILGAGHSYPQTSITNELLRELDPSLDAAGVLARTGVRSRRSVLPLDYIRSTRNADNRAGRKAVTATPTDLAFEAANMALKRAGVAPEQIGLVIADTVTPWETTPSEAQRLAKRYNLRIPAYDVVTTSGALPAHVGLLSSWKEEKLPEFVLSISTSVLTACVDYNAGAERLLLGDGASAMVLSIRVPGRLALESFETRSETPPQGEIQVGIDGFIRIPPGFIENWAVTKTEELAAKAASRAGGSLNLITPQFESSARPGGVEAAWRWYNVDTHGNSLGAGPGCILSEHWDNLQPGGKIGVVQAGLGSDLSYAVLRVL